MPAPLNLIGRRFGKLTVVRRGPRVHYGHDQWSWICRCDCGREETYPQQRLTTQRKTAVRACSVCAAPKCIICGAPILDRLRTSSTCSTCLLIRRREIQRDSKRRETADPERHARTIELRRRRAERLAADPAQAERLRTTYRDRWARRSSLETPEEAEQRRARARAAYAAHADEVQARRRARLDAMTPEQLAAWCEQAKARTRAYRQRHRAEITADPAAHQRYLDLQTEYRRRRRLLTLLTAAAKTLERSDG